jgi:protein O-GlcNAc transferase
LLLLLPPRHVVSVATAAAPRARAAPCAHCASRRHHRYKDAGRVDDAMQCYRKALELKPAFPDAFANLVHSLSLVCDWTEREGNMTKLVALLDKQVAACLPALGGGGGAAVERSALEASSSSGVSRTISVPVLPSVQPFHALAYPLSLRQLQLIATCYARKARLNVALLDLAPFRFKSRNPGQRLRVGYVSSDFGNHPMAHLMASVFGMHDRRGFEVFCYALSGDDGVRCAVAAAAEVVSHCVRGRRSSSSSPPLCPCP